jgi:hypothetical protein
VLIADHLCWSEGVEGGQHPDPGSGGRERGKNKPIREFAAKSTEREAQERMYVPPRTWHRSGYRTGLPEYGRFHFLERGGGSRQRALRWRRRLPLRRSKINEYNRPSTRPEHRAARRCSAITRIAHTAPNAHVWRTHRMLLASLNLCWALRRTKWRSSGPRTGASPL